MLRSWWLKVRDVPRYILGAIASQNLIVARSYWRGLWSGEQRLEQTASDRPPQQIICWSNSWWGAWLLYSGYGTMVLFCLYCTSIIQCKYSMRPSTTVWLRASHEMLVGWWAGRISVLVIISRIVLKGSRLGWMLTSVVWPNLFVRLILLLCLLSKHVTCEGVSRKMNYGLKLIEKLSIVNYFVQHLHHPPQLSRSLW